MAGMRPEQRFERRQKPRLIKGDGVLAVTGWIIFNGNEPDFSMIWAGKELMVCVKQLKVRTGYAFVVQGSAGVSQWWRFDEWASLW